MVRKPPHCHCHVSYHPQTKNKNTQQNCWVLRPWSNVLDLQRKMKPDSTELAKETPKMHIQKSISLAIFHQKSNGTDFSRTLFNKMQSSYYILSFFRGLETVGPVGDFLECKEGVVVTTTRSLGERSNQRSTEVHRPHNQRHSMHPHNRWCCGGCAWPRKITRLGGMLKKRWGGWGWIYWGVWIFFLVDFFVLLWFGFVLFGLVVCVLVFFPSFRMGFIQDNSKQGLCNTKKQTAS